MLRSHYSLRDDYEVSCPELDLVVETMVKNGAWEPDDRWWICRLCCFSR